MTTPEPAPSRSRRLVPAAALAAAVTAVSGALVAAPASAVPSAVGPAVAGPAAAWPSTTAPTATTPATTPAAVRPVAASAPVGSTVVLPLPAGFRPEGIEAGPRGRLFAGSLADGRIWVADPRAGTGEVLVPGVAGRSLRGLRYDPRSGLLWAVGGDGATGVVLAVRAATGAVERRIEVPGAVFLNDLDLTRTAVWVTDSRLDRLTRIDLTKRGRPAGTDPVTLPITGDWPAPAGNRANGVRALDRHTLLVVNSTGRVLRTIDTRTGVATPVRVTGTTLTGGDGLVLRGRTLYVVRGTGQFTVAEFRLGSRRADGVTTWTARWVRDLADPALDVPSTATQSRGRLWTVNARFGVVDPATAAFQIVGLPL